MKRKAHELKNILKCEGESYITECQSFNPGGILRHQVRIRECDLPLALE